MYIIIMFDFQQKNKIRKFLYSRPVVALVLLVSAYFLYSTWSIYQKMVQSREKVLISQKQLLALSAKSTELDTSLADLQTQEGIEKEIRSKFGQAKVGENMAVIIPDKDVSTTSAKAQQTFFSKIKHFFGF